MRARLVVPVLFAMCALAAPHSAYAQSIAIVGGKVYPVSGPPIENGTVLVRDGKIVAVGSAIAIPAGTRRIDATGKVVTPGLVNGATLLGLVEIGSVQSTRDDVARGREGVAASFKPWEGLNPSSVLLGPARDAGITSATRAPVLVALWGSSVEPAELVRIDGGTTTHMRLTDFNVAEATTIDWRSPRHFWFTSKRGRKIHNMIVLPANFDSTKKYPLFVLIHGGAANMWRDQISVRWNYHLLARPGYVMLMTNYSGSSGFGEQFGQSIQGDPLRGPADELVEAADEAIRTFPFIDGSRQVAAGASYGGHLANALEAWSGTRFKALIAHAGLVNLDAQWGTSDGIYHRELQALGPVWEQGEVWRTQSPARSAASFKTPMMLSVGERDYRVPRNNTLEMWSLLQRLRIPGRLLVWPEENHWILNAENSRLFYREVESWFARWVRAGPG
ncbi:MAG: dipeptidyl aminopeptidase/acylaminoacyl peptidase [Gemmatimonadetes bacterium]|nr:dipeptidyl aminopeptidase/acylaminoacyl peptidase [Gemmatimonadota bacterium]